jgi:hypothetical protein
VSRTSLILTVLSLAAAVAILGCKGSMPSHKVLKQRASTTASANETNTSKPTASKPVEYSNMHIEKEEGDFLGWDLQVSQMREGYEVKLFCGEGVPEGPVRIWFASLNGVQTVSPSVDVCGSPMQFEFVDHGVYIRVGDGEQEMVPLHKNFIKQEKYQ